MKIANVSSVVDRGPLTPVHDNSRVERMTALLRRYPNIEDGERQELLTFLTQGPPDEVVRVTHLEGVEPSVRAFRADHPREFRSGWRGWLPMILFVAIAVIGVVWRLSR